MGKIRLMAKFRLAGKWHFLFIFFAVLSFTILFTGDFSFIFETLASNTDTIPEHGLAAAKVVTALTGSALFIVFVPTIKLGCERWLLKTAEGENMRLRELFFYFSKDGIRRSVKAFFYSLLRKSAALIFFLFPSACLSGVLYFSFEEGEISLYISYALLGSAILLFLTGVVFYFIYTAKSIAYYPIIVSNKAISPYEAMEKSARITEGAYRKICLFRLSFIPWALLCVLIVPIFYVWGYYKESLTMLALHNERLHC